MSLMEHPSKHCGRWISFPIKRNRAQNLQKALFGTNRINVSANKTSDWEPLALQVYLELDTGVQLEVATQFNLTIVEANMLFKPSVPSRINNGAPDSGNSAINCFSNCQCLLMDFTPSFYLLLEDCGLG